MYRIEFHPGDGGADAADFASDLASAVAKHTGSEVATEGRVYVVETTHCL